MPRDKHQQAELLRIRQEKQLEMAAEKNSDDIDEKEPPTRRPNESEENRSAARAQQLASSLWK